MTQEDKELLLKDLCARLPYGVIVNVNGNNEKIDEINPFEGVITCGFQSFDVSEIKPYLRPMRSITEEERKEYNKVMFQSERYEDDYAADVDWLNSHHFDYRGLLNKGLALSAPDGMYENK